MELKMKDVWIMSKRKDHRNDEYVDVLIYVTDLQYIADVRIYENIFNGEKRYNVTLPSFFYDYADFDTRHRYIKLIIKRYREYLGLDTEYKNSMIKNSIKNKFYGVVL